MSSTINASNSGFGGIVSTGDSSGVLQLQTTGTTAVTIDTSQKVLIGTTTSPSGGSLQLALSNSLGAGIQLNNSTGVNGGAITSTGGNGLVFFGYTGAMGSETYTERMRIDSSGNVGIGTSSPAANLDMGGSVSDTKKIRFSMGGNVASIGSIGSGTANGLGNLAFWTRDGSFEYERMRIDGSGTLLVGTTTPISASVTPRIFSYAGADTNTTIQTMPCGLALNNAANANASGYGVSLKFHMSFPGESGKYAAIAGVSDGTFANAVALVFYTTQNATGGADNVTERMRISATGSLILVGSTAQKASGTTWSNPSDQRLKENIRDYTKGTAELMQVRVREWEYNGKGGTTEGMKGLGVVADEIMTILPNTVETYNAKLNADDEEDTAIKKFDATEITWLLVKTVQEQQTIINDLKARVTALEAK